MSQNEGYSTQSSSNPSTTRPNNPQYAPLETDQPRRRTRPSDLVLETYVENMLKNSKIFSFIHAVQSKIAKIYNPIATILLAVVFFLANRVPLDERCCKGSTCTWSYYAFIYFTVMAIYEVLRLVANVNNSQLISSIANNPRFKPITPFLFGFEYFVNILVNVNLFYAFLEREDCPQVSSFLTWWAILESVSFFGLIITLLLTFITMIAYLYAEKKRLD